MSPEMIFTIAVFISIPSMIWATLYGRHQLINYFIKNRPELNLTGLCRRITIALLVNIAAAMLLFGSDFITVSKDIVIFTTYWFIWMVLMLLLVALTLWDGASSRRHIMEKRDQIVTEFMLYEAKPHVESKEVSS